MATLTIGKIGNIEGSVEVVHADGTKGSLVQGAPVYADDAVTTGENSNVRIEFLDGSAMNIGPEFTAILDKDVFDPALLQADDTDATSIVLDSSDREVTPDSGLDSEGKEKIGSVEKAEGVVEAVGEDGIPRMLEEGDALYANDVIRVDDDGSVSIKMIDGSDLSFGPGTLARMGDSVTTVASSEPSAVPGSAQPTVVDAAQIASIIQEGRDPTEEATAPAAGETGGNEGVDFTVIEPSNRAVTPTSGHDTHGFELPFGLPEPELLEPEEIPSQVILQGTGLAGTTVLEGVSALFTVSLSKASANDSFIVLSAADGTALSADDPTTPLVNEQDYNNIQFYFDKDLTNPIPANTLTIAAGDTGPVEIYVGTINNDPPFQEPIENYILQADASGGATGIATANGFIEDQPFVIIKGIDPGATGTTVLEGTAAEFKVGQSKVSAVDTTIQLSLTDGTADSTDYDNVQFYSDPSFSPASIITGNLLTIPAGSMEVSVYVKTIDNDPPFDEANETYTVTATGVMGVEGVATAAGIITDLPTTIIKGIDPGATGTTVLEGTAAEFKVGQSKVSAVDTTIQLSLTDGTADSTDYDNVQFYSDPSFSPASIITGNLLTIPAGSMEVSVYVKTIDNDPPFDEANETYTVTATGVMGVEGVATAAGIITDLPTTIIKGIDPGATGTTVLEGTAAEFKVGQSKVSAVDTTIQLSLTDGTADSTDYDNVQFYSDPSFSPASIITGNLLTIPAGSMEVSVYVKTIDNDPPFDEANETYTVTATGVMGVEGVATAAGIITDLPTTIIKGIDPGATGTTVLEGTAAEFKVGQSKVSAVDTTIQLSLTDGTADSTDYDNVQFYSDPSFSPASIITGNLLTIPAGSMEVSVYVKTIDNDPPFDEANETYTVTATGVMGVEGVATAAGIITDLPTTIIKGIDPGATGTTVLEGTAAEFKVGQSKVSAVDTTIQLSLTDGTADSTDYDNVQFYSDPSFSPASIITGNLLTIPAGSMEVSVYVKTIDNDPPFDEANETYTVTATGVMGVEGVATAAGIITDLPTTIIKGIDPGATGTTVLEGTAAEFKVGQSKVSAVDTTIQLSLTDGTADSTDYDNVQFYSDPSFSPASIITGNLLTIPAGSMEVSVYVKTIDNDPPFDEANETYTVTATGVMGVEGVATAAGIITDLPTTIIKGIDPGATGTTVLEGTAAEFKVGQSKVSAVDTTIQLSLTDGTADSTDYDNVQFYSDPSFSPASIITGNLLTIPAGSMEVSVYVKTIDNDPPFDEANETYTVTATGVMGVEGVATAAGIITDLPTTIIKGIDPGATGTTVLEGTAAEFKVGQSKVSAVDTTIQLSLTDGTADSTDYDNVQFYSDPSFSPASIITGNLLTIPAGSMEVSVYVKTIDNDPPFDEANETYTVTATGVMGVEGVATAAGIITDLPTTIIKGIDPGATGTTVLEGTAAEFKVGQSKVSAVDTTIQLSLTDGTADSTDYDNVQFYSDPSFSPASIITGNLLTIPAGSMEVSVYVKTIDNDPPFDEANETYTVTATGVMGVEGVATAAGIITDLPTIIIKGTDPGATGSTVEEGTAAMFTVELTKASLIDTTVQLSLTDDTADSTDYDNLQLYSDAALNNAITGNVLTFTAGTTSIDIYVNTIDNDPPFGEPTEHYTLTATGLLGVEGTATADGFITDSHHAFIVGTNADDVGPDDNVDPHQVNNTPPIDSGTIIGGSNPDILVGDVGGTSATNTNANIILILDTSGSMVTQIDFDDDSDPATPDISISRLAALKLAVDALLTELAGSAANQVRVHIIDFNTRASSLGTFNLKDAGQLDDAKDSYVNLNAAGWTNYEDALQKAIDWSGDSNNLLGDELGTLNVVNQTFFISDGQPTAFNTGNTTTGDNVSDNQTASLSLDHATGDVGTVDNVSEVAILESQFGPTEAIGIAIADPSSSLDNLDEVEGELRSSDAADTIFTANELIDILQDLNPLKTLEPVGDDTINAGDGDDLIFGDSLFTDTLAGLEGITTEDGSGWQVFADLEAGMGTTPGWDRADTIDYIQTNHEELGAESDLAGTGRTGGIDIIDAGGGDDIVYGQEGDDMITGGSGDDIITGGSGADIFIWNSGDEGTAIDPANDTVTDFDRGDDDVLNIADLLDGANSDAGDLDGAYISIASSGGDITLSIFSDGDGATAPGPDQKIVLTGLGLSGSSESMINSLLGDGSLVTE